MKISLSCLGGMAVSLKGLKGDELSREIKGVSRTSLKPLRAIPTICEQCPAGCGVIAYLDGERLVHIQGNPNHPSNQGGICAKGIAGINLANDPERLLYPMKRRGERGAGLWTRITWDEAYLLLAERIREMLEKKRINRLVVDKGQDDPLLTRLIAALGSKTIIDRQALKNINRDKAFLSMAGIPYPMEDVERSRTILNFGANPYASHDRFIPIARRLNKAQMENGARLFTFDVRMSETAARSETWYPIKAGTDGIVALAMARVIVERGLADMNFLEQRTDCNLSELKNHLLPYTLEYAENESGIRAKDIESLAREFATRKPSLAMIGGGISEHENGSENVRCVLLLNWLVGNLDREGGLVIPLPHSNLLTAYLEHGPSNSENIVKGTADLKQNSSLIDTYLAILSNPAYDEPDCHSAARLLADEKIVPFLVVMDTHLTETAMLADIVLPAATYLEGWGLSISDLAERTSVINLKQPVVSLLSPAQALRSPLFEVGKLLEPSFQPRGESREIGNFCLELSRYIGEDFSKSLPFMNTLDFVTKAISSVPGLKDQGGLEALKAQGLWIEKSRDKEAKTAGKIQRVRFHSGSGLHSLPEYRPIAPFKKEGEFILTSFKTNLESKGTANSKWAREILHENRLWMNKKVAERLKIKNGDLVRVSSSVGSLITRVLTTNLIHPESVALAAGLGHEVGNIAKALPFKSSDRDTSLIWWAKEGNGKNPNEVIERKVDPTGGGLTLKDTRVQIEKI
jgi:anaerobic selenocysteine-containing dehydrogenase